MESLKTNDKNMWLIPVVENKQKMYDIDVIEVEEYSDIFNSSFANSRLSEHNIVNIYKNNEIPDQQNKYNYLINQLNEFYTPYLDPDQDSSIIHKQHVNTNLQVVLDNLEDFYSSTAKDDSIKRKRFSIRQLNTPLTRLHIKNESDLVLSTYRTNISIADKLNLKSFLMLPKEAINFSKILLPSVDILTKSVLNNKFYNYSNMLTKKTLVQNIIANSDINFNSDLLNNVSNFVPELDSDYDNYLNNITPSTTDAFNLLKTNFKHIYSIQQIINELEPFSIYQDDITYKHYLEFLKYINEEIRKFNSEMVLNSKLFSKIKFAKYNTTIIPSKIITMFVAYDELNAVIDFAYNINKKLSSSEYLKRLYSIDYGKLYLSSIGYMNNELISVINVEDKLRKLVN